MSGMTGPKSNNYCYLTRGMRGDDSFIFLEFSFNAGFIAKLKSMVPAEYRSYDPAEKRWTIHPRFVSEIKELAKEYFECAWLIEGAIVTDLHTGEVL
jgi:GMP synthase PP-ATPase subunit